MVIFHCYVNLPEGSYDFGDWQSYWCLVGNGWVAVAGMIITSDEMDHSRKFPAFSLEQKSVRRAAHSSLSSLSQHLVILGDDFDDSTADLRRFILFSKEILWIWKHADIHILYRYTVVHVYLYIYIYIYIYLYIHICTYIFVDTYLYIYIYIYICTYIFVHTYLNIHMCTYIFVHTYLYIYIYTYIFVHIYIYIYLFVHIYIYMYIVHCTYANIYLCLIICIRPYTHVWKTGIVHQVGPRYYQILRYWTLRDRPGRVVTG